jgi:hypothetical protein
MQAVPPCPRALPPYSVALIYIALGQEAEAINWLEKAFKNRTGLFVYLAKGDPRLDPVRSDERFQLLLQGMQPDR